MTSPSSQQLSMYHRERAIRVVIVQDRPRVRREIRQLLEHEGDVEVVGMARLLSTASLLIHLLTQQRQPDVVLMDVNVQDGNSIQACQEFHRQFPNTNLMFFQSMADAEAIHRALSIAREALIRRQEGQ